MTPDDREPDAPADDRPFALVRRREGAGASDARKPATAPEDPALPLTRTRGRQPAGGFEPRSFTRRLPVTDADAPADASVEQRVHRAGFAREQTATYGAVPSAPPTRSAPPPPRLAEGARTADVSVDAGGGSGIARIGTPAPARPAELDTIIATIRHSLGREEVTRLACEGATTVARSALFLALHRGVLKGRRGSGPALSPEAVRNLVIPIGRASILRECVERAQRYYGPHGTSAADQLVRSAMGARGERLLLQPLRVHHRVVGILCVDDPDESRRGSAQVEVLANAVGHALERIVVRNRAAART